MLKLEDILGQGYYGQTIGSTQRIDFSQSPQVLLPPGTIAHVGSATLTVAASNSLNPTQADYTCTGTNDQTTINTAIAALPSGGGRVLLLEGQYNLGGAITILKSNVTLEGQGAATILKLSNAADANCIELGDQVNSYVNMTVKNLLVDGNMSNQSLYKVGISGLSNASHSIAENCYIQNTVGEGIAMQGQYAKVINCTVNTTQVGQAGDGIFVSGIKSSIIDCISISADEHGIGLYAYQCKAEGNSIITPTQRGIYCGGAYQTISSNTIINAAMGGIYDNLQDNIISGNSIYCNINSTEALLTAAFRDVVSNNHIIVDTGNTTALTAIQFGGGNVSADGNFVVFMTAYAHIGIDYFSGSTHQTVGNYIYFNSNTTGSTGLLISGNNPVINNNFIYQGDIGLDLDSSLDVACNGNYMYSCNTGIYINAGSGVLNGNVFNNIVNDAIDGETTINRFVGQISAINNYIDGCGKNGIAISGSNNIINNNRIINPGYSANNTYAGILITDDASNFSTYNTITGNQITSSSGNLHKYGIRENSSSDGPNIITNNICLNAATAQISTQNANTDVSHNITT